MSPSRQTEYVKYHMEKKGSKVGWAIAQGIDGIDSGK